MRLDRHGCDDRWSGRPRHVPRSGARGDACGHSTSGGEVPRRIVGSDRLDDPRRRKENGGHRTERTCACKVPDESRGGRRRHVFAQGCEARRAQERHDAGFTGESSAADRRGDGVGCGRATARIARTERHRDTHGGYARRRHGQAHRGANFDVNRRHGRHALAQFRRRIGEGTFARREARPRVAVRVPDGADVPGRATRSEAFAASGDDRGLGNATAESSTKRLPSDGVRHAPVRSARIGNEGDRLQNHGKRMSRVSPEDVRTEPNDGNSGRRFCRRRDD